MPESALTPFPEEFVWGAATASYQIEGAAFEDGKAESIWDRFSHTPGRIRNGDTGDTACDHYHRFRDDVALMGRLGLGAYRFSVSWPRVMRDDGTVNEAGLDFYDKLVDELLATGIDPHATLYHWDLPQSLEDAGGWPVRATAHAFVDYAMAVAGRLGDRIKHFSTLNEPFVVADHGYRSGSHAPGRTEPKAALAAAHHLMVAHGLGAMAIKSVAPQAQVGIVLNFESKTPATTHLLDLEATMVAHDHANRWFLDPIMGHGYPSEGSRAWDWDTRGVAADDLEIIATPIDYLGVNYYTRAVVRSPVLPKRPEPDVERTGMGWEVYPDGLTHILQFVASRTGDLPLFITENGAAYPLDESDPAKDPQRRDYLARHVRAAHEALQHGIPLRGYFAWSLLDNFEWAHGYAHRFGIVHVDFATQERRIRESGHFWSEMARTGQLPG
jgi:beta-glucosidase